MCLCILIKLKKKMAFHFWVILPNRNICKVLYYTHTYAFACFLLHIAQKDENRKNSKVNIMYKSNCKVQSLSPILAVILAENTFEKWVLNFFVIMIFFFTPWKNTSLVKLHFFSRFLPTTVALHCMLIK